MNQDELLKTKFRFNLIKVSNILGIDFFNGAIKVADLLKIMEVAEFKSGEEPLKGYQRTVSEAKINSIASRTLSNLESLDVLVDAININIRSENARSYVKPLDEDNDRYGGFYTFQYISELKHAYLVDGQHRAKGIQRARSILADDRNYTDLKILENTYINISLTLTENIFKEAYIFYLINQYAKNVSPDGATRLMLEGYVNNNVDFKNEVTSGASKQTIDDISCAKIADRLSEKSDIWGERIKDYNETGAGKVSIRAMAQMIKPIYMSHKSTLTGIKSDKSPEDLTFDMIEIFWLSLADIFPEMFDSIQGKDYGITKSSQAEVMMKVLNYILKSNNSDWKNQGKSFKNVYQKSCWIKVLKSLKTFKDDNNEKMPRQVTGKNCWLVGKGGSMGKYTSAAAKRNISINISNHIEREYGIQRHNPETQI